MIQRGIIHFKRYKDCETGCINIHSDPENPIESQTHESYSYESIPGVIWIDWVVLWLFFSIGTGYLNDDIAMELWTYVITTLRRIREKKIAVDLLLRWPQCSMLLLLSTVIL